VLEIEKVTVISDEMRNGWQVRIVYRPGEAERVVIPRFLGYTGDRKVIQCGSAAPRFFFGFRPRLLGMGKQWVTSLGSRSTPRNAWRPLI
jgi:hypothetical protein